MPLPYHFHSFIPTRPLPPLPPFHVIYFRCVPGVTVSRYRTPETHLPPTSTCLAATPPPLQHYPFLDLDLLYLTLLVLPLSPPHVNSCHSSYIALIHFFPSPVPQLCWLLLDVTFLSGMPAYFLQDCHYFYRTALRGLNIGVFVSPLYA